MNTPKVGDIIVVPPADDSTGGKATIREVKDGISAGKPVPFVMVDEVKHTSWNWKSLSERQRKLRESYGHRWAHMDGETFTPSCRRQDNAIKLLAKVLKEFMYGVTFHVRISEVIQNIEDDDVKAFLDSIYVSDEEAIIEAALDPTLWRNKTYEQQVDEKHGLPWKVE